MSAREESRAIKMQSDKDAEEEVHRERTFERKLKEEKWCENST